MRLTDEEQNILDGRRGPVLRKALRAIVRYGEAFGADRLVPIVSSHLVIGTGALLFIQYARMLRETADAGLVFPVPTTVNPRAYDLDDASLAVRLAYPRQRTMEALLTKLGCADTFTCTPYLADNVPAAGDCITWAESSAAVYANSVLGARTNVTPAPMDLMYAILGRAPEYGLLRDEGRLAVCRVVAHPDANSEPALLGYAIGLKVQRGVPWVEGIDCTPDSFKDMSAAANCAGLLPLIHVPGFTYEARQLGESLVRPDATTVRITREDVAAARSQLRGFDCTPTHVVLGCPHLSVEQVKAIARALEGRRVRIPLWLCACDSVWRDLRETVEYATLLHAGAVPRRLCPLAFDSIPALRKRRILTNSSKLARHTGGRYAASEECIEAAAPD